MEELKNGGTNIDSNPTGIFDTNGWAELRVRLPKFRATMEHYARQLNASHPSDVLNETERSAVSELSAAIRRECDRMLEPVSAFVSADQGKALRSKVTTPETMDWKEARNRLSQVLGVLKKTNRDLSSEHWDQEK